MLSQYYSCLIPVVFFAYFHRHYALFLCFKNTHTNITKKILKLKKPSKKDLYRPAMFGKQGHRTKKLKKTLAKHVLNIPKILCGYHIIQTSVYLHPITHTGSSQ